MRNKSRFHYENPLISRYASQKMSYLFSPQFKFSSWRKLWVYLAEAQKELGLNISQEQIEEMKAHVDDIDFEEAEKNEKKFRHDVMAHVHAFAKVAPKAAPIIHLGATSAYVGDNTDLIQMKEALILTREKILSALYFLKQFALQYLHLPTLSYTHFQAAQPTTLGKRACLWMQDLLLDLEELDFILKTMPFRGIKGTTGTQASFLQLFEGDHEKVEKLAEIVKKKAGFEKDLSITGQTYTRKIDSRISKALSSIAESASKFSFDLRLLAHKKEVEEPFESNQIGSSAMAYKRNPMRAERIGSLARFVMALEASTAYTASSQWFERTLDDSANKRLAVPQAFLGVDAILNIYANVASAMVVYDKVIAKNLEAELPFMLTENVLMECVKKGGNRQELHEEIRLLSMKAAERVKKEGKDNNLIELMAQSKTIDLSKKEIETLMKPEKYIGRSVEIAKKFIEEEVNVYLKDYVPSQSDDLKV